MKLRISPPQMRMRAATRKKRAPRLTVEMTMNGMIGTLKAPAAIVKTL